MTSKHYGVFLAMAGAVVIYVLNIGPAKSFSIGTGWSDGIRPFYDYTFV
jgi:hypothetical protein